MFQWNTTNIEGVVVIYWEIREFILGSLNKSFGQFN